MEFSLEDIFQNKFVERSGECEIHGKWTSTFFNRPNLVPFCQQCRDQKVSDEEAKQKAEFERAARERRLKATQIPKRFKQSLFDNFMAKTTGQKKALVTCQRYAERFNEIRDKGTSLILLGKPGCGKTHLACAIINHVAMQLNCTAVYTDIISMIREVKATFNKDSESTEEGVIDWYSNRHLLAIDEVGVQLGSDFEKMIFQDVIDRRYREMLPTIVISNLNVEDLKNVVGDRAVDRLKDNGGALVSFDWASHRGAA